jgi:hypothetical protein
MRVVNLLCKGRSLMEFNKLPDSEFIVLANDFDKEIIKIKTLSDYLQNQTIHQVLNMTIGGANGYHSIDFFNKFNVVKLIRPYLEGIRIPGSSGMDFYDNLNYGVSNYLVDCPEGRDFKKDFWTLEEMQTNFCRLIKSNPNIQVNMTTMCTNFIDEMENLDNLNINKIGDYNE